MLLIETESGGDWSSAPGSRSRSVFKIDFVAGTFQEETAPSHDPVVEFPQEIGRIVERRFL